MRFLFPLVFVVLFSSVGLAQFNVKVGYQYAYSNPTIHNSIIDQLNLTNKNTLTNYQAMSSLKPLHGATIGFRYRFQPVALFAEWSPLFQVRDFKGVSGGSDVFRRHFYRLDSYSVGLEFFVNQISFGGSLDYNYLKVRAENSERSDRFIILQDYGWGSHFFVGFNLYGNESLSIGIQPYVRIPWTKFDWTDLENNLGTDSNLPNYKEGLMTYGVRIVFQNGYYEN